MARLTLRSGVAASLLVTAAWGSWAQVAPRAAAPVAAAKPDAIATVGPLSILRQEFDQRVQQGLAEYRARSGSEVPAELQPMVKRQMLESLIRRDLLILEAKRRGLAGTEQEAEEQLKKDPFFQQNGRFDQAKFVAVRAANPAVFADAIQQMRASLGARKLNDQLQAENRPPDAELRARAARGLGRAALDYLVLRRPEFNGANPEPRESEVLDYYRAHADEFHRPARLTVSVVYVDQPALSDSEAAVPAAAQAWRERMKQRADSALAAIRGGASFEQAAAPFGGPRAPVVVMADNFPGYWRASEAQDRALFATRPGTVFPEALPAKSGWLLVRVVEAKPERTAPLAEVAREVRGKLRGDRRQHFEERELRALYAALRDSLKTTAYQLRWAALDTGTVAPGEPTAADLDRYYRGHLADYSTFSSAAGGVVARPFEEVRDEVRARWLHDRRGDLARAVAGQLQDAWSHGRRDPALERRAQVREAGPLPPGAPLDTGAVARLVADSLAARRGALGVGIARSGAGYVVFHVTRKVEDFVPSFELARARLAERRIALRATEDEAGARQLFERSPEAFAVGDVIHFSRFFITPQELLSVPLTRAEVEKQHREHMERYSAPELVSARHILISPKDSSPAADRAARARADSVLERVRAGEEFAELARRYTDDEATRDKGGDLGPFGRGSMLPEFEKAAFAMRAGDVSSLVKTEVGYHIIKVTDYLPAVAQPLVQMYSNVAVDAAFEKADTLAKHRADSLYRRLKTPALARATARQLGLEVFSYTHAIGQREQRAELQDFYRKLETIKPGQFYPGTFKLRGQGWVVTWVDSITPPRAPTWEQARDQAIARYRAGAGQRVLDAKCAELDSMLAAGWSLDSLGGLWGGIEHLADAAPGQGLPGFGAAGQIDSLAFGAGGAAALEPGQTSGWVAGPTGAARVRLVERRSPDPVQLAALIESERRAGIERGMLTAFERLKQRYPVRILDARLREVLLPTPAPARP
ncbi:MAG: peptidyl-prolyl cis-trans isomerase [Candidatus Eisenbacteria bacterium]|nr:peptidyl-prolyl cis-trans isomerase [Candidatus Eisenbacteria bacterium]